MMAVFLTFLAALLYASYLAGKWCMVCFYSGFELQEKLALIWVLLALASAWIALFFFFSPFSVVIS